MKRSDAINELVLAEMRLRRAIEQIAERREALQNPALPGVNFMDEKINPGFHHNIENMRKAAADAMNAGDDL